MTRKRYLAVAGMLTVLIDAGFAITMMMQPVPGFTMENYRRIKKGMMRADVETVLGAPSGSSIPIKDSTVWIWWENKKDGGQYTMVFRHDKVIGKDGAGPDETIVEKLRRWLRL